MNDKMIQVFGTLAQITAVRKSTINHLDSGQSFFPVRTIDKKAVIRYHDVLLILSDLIKENRKIRKDEERAKHMLSKIIKSMQMSYRRRSPSKMRIGVKCRKFQRWYEHIVYQ